MKLLLKFTCLFFAVTLFLSGCDSQPAGTVGDENDPAMTSDDEQMQEEEDILDEALQE